MNRVLINLFLILLLVWKPVESTPLPEHPFLPGHRLSKSIFLKIKRAVDQGQRLNPDWTEILPLALQDIILGQTNLNLVNSGGDLVYEGEITQYSITPMTSTANLTAAQNRLTMNVNLRYFNTKNEEDDFESQFSFFYDFPADKQLYDIQGSAHDEIFERITQDIFNATLAKW